MHTFKQSTTQNVSKTHSWYHLWIPFIQRSLSGARSVKLSASIIIIIFEQKTIAHLSNCLVALVIGRHSIGLWLSRAQKGGSWKSGDTVVSPSESLQIGFYTLRPFKSLYSSWFFPRVSELASEWIVGGPQFDSEHFCELSDLGERLSIKSCALTFSAVLKISSKRAAQKVADSISRRPENRRRRCFWKSLCFTG